MIDYKSLPCDSFQVNITQLSCRFCVRDKLIPGCSKWSHLFSL